MKLLHNQGPSEVMMPIADSYRKIRHHIDILAKQAGRNPGDVMLLAVSKTYPWDHLAAAYQAGCRDFGESKIQEAIPKIEQAPKDISWHLIGTLQKNKVRKAVGVFSLIHSVENLPLAQKISECSLEKNIATHVLLQVNTSGEVSKHGLKKEEWAELFHEVMSLPGIIVDGLMTLGPNVRDVERIRTAFRDLRELKEELNASLPADKHMHHLSMGMSGDYPIAIEEGATIVRIGTSIFGDR